MTSDWTMPNVVALLAGIAPQRLARLRQKHAGVAGVLDRPEAGGDGQTTGWSEEELRARVEACRAVFEELQPRIVARIPEVRRTLKRSDQFEFLAEITTCISGAAVVPLIHGEKWDKALVVGCITLVGSLATVCARWLRRAVPGVGAGLVDTWQVLTQLQADEIRLRREFDVIERLGRLTVEAPRLVQETDEFARKALPVL